MLIHFHVTTLEKLFIHACFKQHTLVLTKCHMTGKVVATGLAQKLWQCPARFLIADQLPRQGSALAPTLISTTGLPLPFEALDIRHIQLLIGEIFSTAVVDTRNLHRSQQELHPSHQYENCYWTTTIVIHTVRRFKHECTSSVQIYKAEYVIEWLNE